MSVQTLSAFVPSMVLEYLNSLENLGHHRSHTEHFEGVVMIAGPFATVLLHSIDNCTVFPDMSGFTKLSEALAQDSPMVNTCDAERALEMLSMPAHKVAATAKLFRFSNRTERQSYGVSLPSTTAPS